MAEVRKLAMMLPEKQRGLRAAQLLESLPPFLHDDDEGVAEALKRNAELDARRSAGISLEELQKQIRER
jgi:hypothetical protein